MGEMYFHKTRPSMNFCNTIHGCEEGSNPKHELMPHDGQAFSWMHLKSTGLIFFLSGTEVGTLAFPW